VGGGAQFFKYSLRPPIPVLLSIWAGGLTDGSVPQQRASEQGHRAGAGSEESKAGVRALG
jgi:hypothetical protein